MSAELTRLLRNRPRSQQSDHQRRIADSLKASEWCIKAGAVVVVLAALAKAAGWL